MWEKLCHRTFQPVTASAYPKQPSRRAYRPELFADTPPKGELSAIRVGPKILKVDLDEVHALIRPVSARGHARTARERAYSPNAAAQRRAARAPRGTVAPRCGSMIATYSLDEVVATGNAPSVRWLQREIRASRVTARKIGRSWRMTGQDIADMLEARRNTATLPARAPQSSPLGLTPTSRRRPGRAAAA